MSCKDDMISVRDIMTRTIISLDPDDKSWLDKRAAATGKTMTEIVREAVRRMRKEEESAFGDLLNETRGLWRSGDGLAYQRRLRKEWR
jgi:hypothetical protein